MEEFENILKVIGTSGYAPIAGALIAGFLSKYAWDFYKKKIFLDQKERESIRKEAREDKEHEQKDKDELKSELKERISSLEKKLETALKEKESLLKQVFDLKTKLVKIETKLEILLSGGMIPYDEDRTDPGIGRPGKPRRHN